MKFSKTNIRFEISIFKISYKQNLVKIRKLIPFGPRYPNLGIWAENLKNESIRKFQISSILKIWIVLGRFIIFGGSFRFVSGRFGSLRVLVSTFLNMGSNGITSCDFCLPATDIFECLNVILTSFFEFFYQVN